MAHWMFPGDKLAGGTCSMSATYSRRSCRFVRDSAGYVGRFMAQVAACGRIPCRGALQASDIVGTVVALSGLYSPQTFVSDYMDDNVYFNFPLCYLPNLTDPWYIDRFRDSDIVICVGQGAWEEDSLRETRALEADLHALGVQAWVDYWGHNVSHDWPWWRQQLPYFLGELDLS